MTSFLDIYLYLPPYIFNRRKVRTLCRLLNNVKIGNYLGNLIEHVQSLMHHSPPRLPLIAIAAAFPAFSTAYSVFSTRLLQHTRWLTIILCFTISFTLKLQQLNPHVSGLNAYIPRPFGHPS